MGRAFIFSTSHLPENRSQRPEEEEEEEDVQPMLRAGGVRAFSHLPEQAAEGVAKEVPAATRPMRAFQPQGALSAHEALRAAASAVGRSLGDRMPLLDPRRETKEYRPRFGDEPVLKGGAQLRILEDLAHPDERQEHPDLPHVRGAEPVHGFRQNGSLFQDPVSQEDLYQFLQEQGDKPEIREMLQRHGDESEVQDLLQRSVRTRNTALADSAVAADSEVMRPVAHERPAVPQVGSAQPQRDTAAPFVRASSVPQARSEGQMPAPQNYTDEQNNPTAEAATQKPAAKGSQPVKNYTELEKKELFIEGKLKRRPIGQLGITASSNIQDPVKTASGKKPHTVCFYDSKEDRKSDDGITADAVALRQAAATYASNDAWMIDIADPNWREKLQAIKDAEESKGQYIDRIMIFDHGGSGNQEFGNQRTHLDPNSKDWKLISSSVRPRGHIVLIGCEVAKTDWDYTQPQPEGQTRRMMTDGADYVRDLYIGADSGRTPTIHAYDKHVKLREGRLMHAVTEGEEYSYGLEGAQGTEQPPD